MKQHIISLPHHPKRVIVISLVIALIAGAFGYFKINQKTPVPAVASNSDISNPASGSRDITLGFLAGGRIKSVSVQAGDTVKKGQVLAALDAGNTLGALTQAQAAYQAAQASYNKVLNGATSSAIDVAKAAVNSAQVNLEGVTKQQNLLVANARANLLNSTITANPINPDSTLTPPTISGTYIKDAEGSIDFSVIGTGSGGYISFDGIASGTSTVSTATPQVIGDTGLYIEFPSVSSYIGTSWKINIPNNTAPNYLANYNAYQSALQAENQAISNAQATLDQAQASLTALQAAARPEDVASAKAQVDNAAGAVQIAEAAYQNTIIVAPSDGVVVSVAITPGQIAVANAPAIDFKSAISSN